jgi:RNA polymerase sigma-70 factor (ECF subfamily)
MDNSANFSDQVRSCAVRMTESGVAALSGLFDLTSQRLVRYAATITRNQHDAEDSVQAALVRVAGNTSHLREADAPWPYLLRMVRNEALQIIRRKKRWGLIANLSDLLTGRLVDEVEREESHRAVWTALRTLPTEQAEVVVLKIWEDMTFAEIGKVLEISTFTAASRYRYAMAKLTQKLTAAHVKVVHE